MTSLICAFLLILTSAAISFSQDGPRATLVDEFDEATCEDLDLRLQNLYTKLAQNPGSRAAVTIRTVQNDRNLVVEYNKRIQNRLRFWKLDTTRLDIFNGEDAGRLEIHFWLVPPGAANPANSGPVLTIEKYDLTKPFIYGTSTFGEDCPTFLLDLYADLIKANQNVRGHIVIFPYARLLPSYVRESKWQTASNWIGWLTKDFGVPRNRLRLYFGKPSLERNAEFWIVPIKKK
jgi:hypothetical protein